jgi:hypothetical protein
MIFLAILFAQAKMRHTNLEKKRNGHDKTRKAKAMIFRKYTAMITEALRNITPIVFLATKKPMNVPTGKIHRITPFVPEKASNSIPTATIRQNTTSSNANKRTRPRVRFRIV